MEENKFIITAFITIGLAILSYVAKYINDIRIAKRKDKLERINRQLKELYGPLYSLTSASHETWQVFRKNVLDKSFDDLDTNEPITEYEKEIWRTWISIVFFPINEKLFNLILENGDLIIEDEFPVQLKELCAHFESYKPVIAEWNENKYLNHTGLINFPQTLLNYSEKSFKELKTKQRKLIE